MDIWDAIAEEASAESELWAAALLPRDEQRLEPVFSPLSPARFALGIETIYEGYLLHYGQPRLFQSDDPDTALLLGDYLYAHGLVRVAEYEEAGAVADLAALISLSAHLRAEGADGDGAAWAATAVLLGEGVLADGRAALRDRHDPGPLLDLATAAAGEDAVRRSLEAHAGRVRQRVR